MVVEIGGVLYSPPRNDRPFKPEHTLKFHSITIRKFVFSIDMNNYSNKVY